MNAWLDEVAILSARIEAILDHDEEDDIVGDDAAILAIGGEAQALGKVILAAAEAPPVERLHDGVRVVIGGPPNAGKSTLLNLLVERDAAIVSPIAGTTRDRIEAAVMRRGVPYILSDTAGLTGTDDVIEAIGVERAHAAIMAADILLWLGDDMPPRTDAIWLQPRADLPGRETLAAGRVMLVRQSDTASIDAVWERVSQAAEALLPRADALPWRRRHRDLCRAAGMSLCGGAGDPLILGEQLRNARAALAQITGVDATEVMLDALFSRFCLGK